MLTVFNRDAIPRVIEANLEGYSSTFSHFLLYRPSRIMFDCGEGAGVRLDQDVFVPEVLAISHGHFDHCRGLAGFLAVRLGIKGANSKELAILYPKRSALMAECRAEVERLGESENVTNGIIKWIPLEDGDEIPLRRKRVLQATTVPHIGGEDCLAYRIGFHRPRLRGEYRSWTASQIQRFVREHGRAAIEEPSFEIEVVYSGDTRSLDPTFCQGCQILIHEGSLLGEADEVVEKGQHSTVLSAMECAARAGARNLVLFHVSRRYSADDVRRVITEEAARLALTLPILALRGSFRLPTD